MRLFKVVGAILFALLMSACGGGGGGDSGDILTVTLDYGGSSALLFRPSNIVPTLSGFQGHAPQCSLGAGALPAGMALNADCSISGRPTAIGVFPVTVHVGAAGVGNQINWNISVAVLGPSTAYQPNLIFASGTVFDQSPLNAGLGWTPVAGETVTYSVVSGILAPGLTLDSSTGRIQGTLGAPGSYPVLIGVTVSDGVTTASTQQSIVTPITIL